MKVHPAFALFSLVAIALPVYGDTFVMKDGTTFEGTILRQNDTSYVVEVQITSSIKDERVVAKADVGKIDKAKPDLAAFEAIAGFMPVPDALTADDYAGRIKEVEKFISTYPGSSKTPDARKMLAAIKSEASEIVAGSVKLDGKIIPAEAYRANAYETDARIEAAKIKKLVDESRYLEALRAFSAFDRDFRNTGVHDELSPLVNRVIHTYIGEISQSLASFDARSKRRQVGLERMPVDDRRASERAIAEENSALEKRFAAEKAAKVGWVTTHPFFKPSLEETVTFGKLELARLAKQNKLPVVDGGKIYRDTLSAIQAGDKTAVAADLTSAKNAAIPQRYLDTLEAAASSAGLAP